MRKNITPLLKPLRISSTGSSGGSLYVFPSACEDIGLNINGGVNNVNLSHYALLNIPPASIKQILFKDDDQNPTESGTDNINITSDPNLNTGENISDTPEGFARALIMSLQNYAMNCDTAIINQYFKQQNIYANINYNYNYYNTYAEDVFWHWLYKAKLLNLNNIRIDNDNNQFILFENSYNKDNNIDIQDNTVIKCFGSISGSNNVQNKFGTYNETYITIPTSYGAGPILFCNNSDQPLIVSTITSSQPNVLEGLGANQYMSYLGYDKPFYDLNSMHSYNIIFSDVNEQSIRLIKDPKLIAKKLKYINQFKDINTDLIQSYDDINIDIHNQLHVDTEFDFNAILLYYSIFDATNNKTSNIPQATNLFGILFLDAPIPAGTNEAGDKLYYLKSHKKTKSTEQRFGNSFSFRVNLNTLPIYDNTDAIIQDSTTTSGITATESGEFISILNKSIDILAKNTKIIKNIQSDYKSIKNFYTNNSEKIDDLTKKVDNYVKGKLSNIINIDKIYTKHIIPIDEGGIKIYPAHAVVDSSAPIMSIDNNGVNIGALYTNNITTDALCFHPTVSSGDTDVYGNLNKSIFDIFNKDTLKIKKQLSVNYTIANSINHIPQYNKLYLDPDSKIFSQNNEDFLGSMKNSNNEINYIGLLPHIIAYFQNFERSIYENTHRYAQTYQTDSLQLELLNSKNELDSYITMIDYFSKLQTDIINIHAILNDIIKKIKNN